MNASRAQLVREVIRPALAAGTVVLCDRFYDSTTAYQGHGRQLALATVKAIIDFAVDGTRPDLTLLLEVPIEVSKRRRRSREVDLNHGTSGGTVNAMRDRIEEEDSAFFERVHEGFRTIASAEPQRVRVIDASQGIEAVSARVWEEVARVLKGP
jgi:dTMP kinase